MYLKAIERRLISHIPHWLGQVLRRARRGRADAGSARYCYAVWLRHLTLAARDAGLDRVPDAVAELGPGASLGVGLAALLSGASRYHALDVARDAPDEPEQTRRLLDELLALFERREPIPGPTEFPRLEPALESYAFPHELLTDDHLGRSLAASRVEAIRAACAALGAETAGIRVAYHAPWHDPGVIEPGSVDFIVSQAVLECVDDLATAYHATRQWLRPGGLASHQIDLRSHGTSDRWWNGHWEYPPRLWAFLRGARPSLINREPVSTHVQRLTDAGFRILTDRRTRRDDGIPRDRLAPPFRRLSDDDLATSAIFIQATTA